MNPTFATESIALLMIIFAFLIAFTCHEFAHAVIAYYLGDDTAQKAGRITLNPLAHIDPFGFLCLILFRIGWGKPVPMNPANFRYPRLFEIIASLAGPMTNILLAVVFIFGYKHLGGVSSQNFMSFLLITAQINVMLGVFNLIPIPPLDGSHILTVLVPKAWQQIYQKYQLLFVIALFFVILLPATQKALLIIINKAFEILYQIVI